MSNQMRIWMNFNPARLVIGLGVGIALGVVRDNIAVGIAIGVGVGIVFSLALTRKEKDESREVQASEWYQRLFKFQDRSAFVDPQVEDLIQFTGA